MLDVQTILFATDDSPTAEGARPLAESLARHHGATLHTLRVEVAPPADTLRLDRLPSAETAPDGSISARRVHPTPSAAIVAYADEIGADLVVMGSHGRAGWNRLMLGSTAEAVLRRTDSPVLTVGTDARATLDGPVLAPVAFESSSDAALEAAVALAEDLGTRVVALHVVEPVVLPVPYAMTVEPFDRATLEASVRETMDRWASAYADGPAPVGIEVRHGLAAAEIVAAAEALGAGLIVQATAGRRGLGRWLLGSVAEAVVRHAPCPVLTLRAGARRAGPAARASREAPLPVPRADWAELFDGLSRRVADAPHMVTVEVASPGADGAVFRDAPLVGITYDPRADTLDVIASEGGEHRVVHPFSVRADAGPWTLDSLRDDGATGPWAFAVVGADGGRHRIVVREAGETA